MRDLTEAELIDMESRVVRLLNAFEDDPDEMSRFEMKNAFDIARDRIAAVVRDVETLCDHARALSIEAQKMENLAAKDAA